MYQHTM